MRIVEIRLYDHPHQIGHYTMSAGALAEPRSTLVELRTDDGRSGWGEVCPAGPLYQPAHVAGIRAAYELIGPALIGVDPRRIVTVHDAMDGVLNGSLEAKAAVDIACWDLMGKFYGERLCDLLGGPRTDPVPTYHVVGIGQPQQQAARAAELQDAGHTKLQLKAGGRHVDEDVESIRAVAAVLRPGTDLYVDVNRGWTVEEAIRVSIACDGIPMAIEQPCGTLDECGRARPHLRHPLLIDESATDLATIARAITSGLVDGLGMKLTRIGGVTAMRAVRDLCASTGTPSSCDDSWGGDIIAAACVQLGSTFAPHLSRGAWIAAPYIEGHYDEENGPRIENGRITIPPGPGLGIAIEDGRFGEPIASY